MTLLSREQLEINLGKIVFMSSKQFKILLPLGIRSFVYKRIK